MKTLIVYYSFTGNNKALAERLQRRLQCDVLRIEEEGRRTNFSIFLDLIFRRKPNLKKYSFSSVGYDNIIFVAPIWAAKVSSPMKRFLELEKDNIGKYSFISLCGGVAGQKEKLTEQLLRITGRKPELVEELWISSLDSPGSKTQMNYALKDEDWASFYPAIGRFIRAINPSLAGPVTV